MLEELWPWVMTPPGAGEHPSSLKPFKKTRTSGCPSSPKEVPLALGPTVLSLTHGFPSEIRFQVEVAAKNRMEDVPSRFFLVANTLIVLIFVIEAWDEIDVFRCSFWFLGLLLFEFSVAIGLFGVFGSMHVSLLIGRPVYS